MSSTEFCNRRTETCAHEEFDAPGSAGRDMTTDSPMPRALRNTMQWVRAAMVTITPPSRLRSDSTALE